MLDIKNWKVSIPLTMKVIGYIGENMTNKIVFYLEDLNFKDFSFFLDAEFSNKSTFSKLLDKEITDKGIIITFNVTKEFLLVAGEMKCCIRAEKESKTKKTNIFNFIISDSVILDTQLDLNELYLKQFEEKILQLIEKDKQINREITSKVKLAYSILEEIKRLKEE